MSVHAKMTAIADAIREKTGETAVLTLDGMAAAIPEVYAAGAKSEYDRFWDTYQQNGDRRHYGYAFCYDWTDESFKPKYPIVATSLGGTFMYSEVNTVPEIDATAVTNCNSAFTHSKVKSIAKFKVSENSVLHTNMFNLCYELENIIFEGVIPTGINLSTSPLLTHDSLMSAIRCLKDYSGSGTTYTCTLGTANLAKLTDAEKAIATQKGWTLA